MNNIRSFAWTWRTALFISAMLLACALPAQERARRAPLNYDEAKVPPYTLPDLLTCEDGTKVKSAADWPRRRAELLDLFATHVYGKTPAGRPPKLTFVVTSEEKQALGGTAIRKEVSVLFSDKAGGPRMDLLIYAMDW